MAKEKRGHLKIAVHYYERSCSIKSKRVLIEVQKADELLSSPHSRRETPDALLPGRLGLSCKANAATPGLGTSVCYLSMEHRHPPGNGLATIRGFGVGGQELEQFTNAPMRTILAEPSIVRKCPIKLTPIRYPQPICNSIDLMRGALHTTKKIR